MERNFCISEVIKLFTDALFQRFMKKEKVFFFGFTLLIVLKMKSFFEFSNFPEFEIKSLTYFLDCISWVQEELSFIN